MKKKYILAVDQGTTGSRAIIFDENGTITASSYQEFQQYYPKPGWVEHDAEEIWQSCVSVIRKALTSSGINQRQIAALGITNQRETTVLWDRKTSKPVGKAIVWQCRRTADICRGFKQHESLFHRHTGLVLDPYFSGTKIKWFFDHIKGLRGKAEEGDICFGTIDSWLIWKMTDGKSHATDPTNASRTLIFDIRKHTWDPRILKILDIPEAMLPQVQPSGSVFGYTSKALKGLISGIPITSVLGDQQAALFGQGCYEPGSSKNTYGTGCFMVMNTGPKLVLSKKGLLSTIACDEKGRPVYALEGAVFNAGTVVQWMRDGLQWIREASETGRAVQGLKSSEDVYFVPAFTGLGAPYWDAEARGLICGLTRGSNKQHIIRAGLESIAYQSRDVFDLMQKEYRKDEKEKAGIKTLKVDGGACRNDFLMQFQSDILNCAVVRPRIHESTAFGAALLAGVTVGLWKTRKDLAVLQKTDRTFKPSMEDARRQALYQGWKEAVGRARS